MEVYLSQVEKELFELVVSHLGYSNFTKEELTAIRSLADGRSIIIKIADKGSCVVVLERNDYIFHSEKQLRDENIYQDVNFSGIILQDLVDKSNKTFRRLVKLLKKNSSTCQKANLGKMYLLPNVPGRPVISNCVTPTEKVSEFLDFQLKLVMQSSKSYIKDSADFIRKIKDTQYIICNAILLTADVIELYPSIPHDSRLKALKNILDKGKNQTISTADLVKMTEFTLRNNYFEFNGKVKQQILGTAIGTKWAPTYACIYLMNLKASF